MRALLVMPCVMEQHFNIWAPGDHWSDGTAAPPPAHDATLTLDWFRYDPL